MTPGTDMLATFCCHSSLWEAVARCASRRGVSRSEFVRNAIREAVERDGDGVVTVTRLSERLAPYTFKDAA